MTKSTIKVYLDMDGVIADFDEGVRNLTGKYPKEQEQRDMWRAIKRNEREFWKLLPAKSEYLKLISFLEKNFEHLLILSSPGNGGTRTVEGKLSWLETKNIKISPIFRKDKQVYAEPNSLLIDDWSKNIEKWKQAGGQTVHYQNFKDAKKQLEEILERERGRL